MQVFEARRDDLRRTRFLDLATPELEPGQALLAVDAFGLTSNNITYAVLGEAMSYWKFFPAAEEGWGRIPVWGFARVAASEHAELAEGTRLYGYLPLSTHLVVAPNRVEPRGFVDASPHRAELPAVYNSYLRVDADPAYDPRYEDQQMLLRPLFLTSFLLDDYLAAEGFFGAEAIVMSSASSKTALVAGFFLARREQVDVIGLTSARNVEFVEGTGVYDRVAPYDVVESLPPESAVYVDFAGDGELRAAIHRHYGDRLAHSAIVGFTHWEQPAGEAAELPGPRPTIFFAPDRIKVRTRDWGRDGLDARSAEAWRDYVGSTERWLEVVHARGPEAVEGAYRELLDGQIDPAVGHVLSLSA
jgi:hypothetical protein